jgi:anti-sigma factor RsiW
VNARSHDEIAELLGVYALHALDPDERERVERHLEDCPRCRAEVADHTWVATTLGNSGGDAPDGVWDRIAGELDATPPRMRLALPEAGPAEIVPFAARSTRPRARAAAIVGSIAAALLLIAGLAVQVVRQDERIAELHVALQADALESAATMALTDPDSARVRLTSADGRLEVSAVVLRDGSGYLMAEDLPALARDRTYQLWGQTGSGLVSLGLLGSDPGDVVAFQAGDQVAVLAITDEHAGGVRQSANPPTVIGRFD